MLAEAGKNDEELLIADLLPQDYAVSMTENTYLSDLRV